MSNSTAHMSNYCCDNPKKRFPFSKYLVLCSYRNLKYIGDVQISIIVASFSECNEERYYMITIFISSFWRFCTCCVFVWMFGGLPLSVRCSTFLCSISFSYILYNIFAVTNFALFYLSPFWKNQSIAIAWNAEDLMPPAERYIFTFNSKEELKRWHLYSDSEYGGLYLSQEFKSLLHLLQVSIAFRTPLLCAV